MRRIIQLFTLVLAAALLVVPAARSASSDMVVSQVFAGGGNTNAPYTNDFVELFNRGTATVDLSTWSIQYATGSGTTWQVTPLSGSVPAGGHYLIQLASAAAIGASLPTPDATGTSNLAVSGGKVALVHSATALTCGASAGSCSADASVVDLVGYGSATDYEGGAAAPALSNTTAAVRTGGGCTDADANSSDFSAAAPTPRNSAAAAAPCSSGSPPPAGVAKRRVDLDIQSVLSIALERPSISFGSASPGETPDAGLGAGDRREQSPSRVRADRPPLGFRPVRPAAWPLGSSAERRPARQRSGQRRYGGDSDRPGARPAHRDDVRSEHCGRRCLGGQRRVRLPAAGGPARSLHGHRHLHGDRAMTGLSLPELGRFSSCSRSCPHPRARARGRPPSRSPRRPRE